MRKLLVGAVLLYVTVAAPIVIVFCLWLILCGLAIIGGHHVWANQEEYKKRWRKD